METLQIFTTIFISVLIGAFPFLLVAVMASGLIEVFVSRDIVNRLLPKNPYLGIVIAPLFGFFLPLCECGIIPVAGRLTRKGVPLAVALSFMLANPILNPFPLLSTRLAFPFFQEMVVWRMGGAYGIAVFTGFLMLVLHEQFPSFRTNRRYLSFGGLGSNTELAASLALEDTANIVGKLRKVLIHASMEFFNVGRYFILGSFFAALINVFIARDVLEAAGNTTFFSVSTMMVFAFLLSVCSEADAFVAATFASTFPPGALLAFMLFGPMVDIKNTLMMLATFRRPVVYWLIGIVFVQVFLLGLVMNLIL